MWKKLFGAALALALTTSLAIAQTNPGLTQNQKLTPAQWNNLFASKQDTLGYTPLNTAGGVMGGRLVTAAPGASTSGLNLTPGSTPGSPSNGDLWATSSSLYARIGGATYDLIGATAVSITVGLTDVLSGTSNGLLFNNAGKVGNLATLANGVLVTSAGGVPSISTTLPDGMALGSPLSIGTLPAFTLGGAISGGGNQINNVIIGTSNPLAGNFTSLAFSTTLTGTSTSSACGALGRLGATNPVLQVDCSAALQVTGVKLTGAAAGGGAFLAAISSGVSENLLIDAKGAGGIVLGNSSTGNISLSRPVNFGAAGSVVGQANFLNATSGSISIAPPSGALGTVTNTLQAATDTFVYRGTSDTLTNKIISASSNVLGGVTMTLGSDASGDIYYRNAGGVLTRLPIGTNGQVLQVNSNLPSWQAGSSAGTVTSGSTAVAGCSTEQILYNNAGTLGCRNLSSTVTAGGGVSITGTTNPTFAVNLSAITNSLGANVTLAQSPTYTDGPSVAQGTTGTWFASGTVVLNNTGAASSVACKLWDGTTIIDSIQVNLTAASARFPVSLSGYLASPAANIKISCTDNGGTNTSRFSFNDSGNNKDSSLSAFRIQ